jgi:hypothetical protein
MHRVILLPVLLLLLAAGLPAQEYPITPYTDPSQLDCPWPKSSHYKQPWRGYLETRSGYDFLQGLGINLHLPDENDELAIRLLAETGFKTARIEIGWGESNWDENALNNERKFRKRLQLLAANGIRPTILVNAHQGVPCPMKTFKRRLLEDAATGATKVKLDSFNEVMIERTGLSGLSEYWAAEALITAIDDATHEATLSKPLPKDLKAGEVELATLKYAPLAPAGTQEFEETAAGWVAHALRVCRLAKECGVKEFDVEIWNELTFGTRFLDINNYYAKAAPKFPAHQPDSLREGGRCWELAKRMAAEIKGEFPQARVIWGFSNTTFFHTPVEKLPPGIDGQSYHPYGTGTRRFEGTPPRRDQAPLEGFTPVYETRMPEGIAQTFIQTESIIRHLNPLDRLTRRPPGTARFYHYMTEHGVLAKECGVEDEAGAWQLKALCASRSFLLWLNKGVDALHYFDAYERDPKSFGVLPANLPKLAPSSRFAKVATPPMLVIRKLAMAFGGSGPVKEIAPLQIEVTALDAPRNVFDGDGEHPPLTHRDVFVALPFQLDSKRHLVAFYIMTRDARKTIAPERYRLRISGAKGTTVSATDPHEDRTVKVEIDAATAEYIEVTVPAVEHPRLLTIGS